ncbi:MAG TPA: PP2C family protein-serine/threonine phosphatase, partial [Thermoanaerobaculia bacterium]|nr:PP2C family protein-serine/threonine phosphatase [Thermoanaerobaculia bacterium]
WRSLVAFGLIVVLFLGLLLKSRLSVINGALLALAALASLRPIPDMTLATRGSALWATGETVVWLFLLWSSAESMLRATGPDFTTSLDALRAGRLGPRGGRSLLLGFACGTGLAGLRLGLFSLAEALPGVWAEEPSVPLPVFGSYYSPVADGIALAALVALALAFALRVLPARWAPVASALALAILLPHPQIHPYAAEVAASAVLVGVLTWVCQRHGLTALLTATIVSFSAPLALFSFQHLDWLEGGFAGTAGLCAAVVLLGFVGLSRSPAGEVERLTPPAFVRHLDEERRLRHEMTLLARMQRGLLPRKLPQLAGYEIAARSVLASEAGGDLYDFLEDDEGHLWIAAGDVAGHGYSCAVTQAMTKAALASLIGRLRTPAEILQRIDQVLRAAGPTRTFATLALLRLRPETGEAVLANAGHPFPLLAAGDEVTEVAVPGLPLGKGPGRRYVDVPLVLPPGSALVFFSDGLFEAADAKGTAYGDERARKVLRRTAQRTAERILEAFFVDWRRHLRTTQALDDTTLVVLKRPDGRS